MDKTSREYWKNDVKHIFESGANEIRVLDLLERCHREYMILEAYAMIYWYLGEYDRVKWIWKRQREINEQE